MSIDGQLGKIMVVIKMRGGHHSKDIREYEITSKGVVILGDLLTDYQAESKTKAVIGTNRQ